MKCLNGDLNSGQRLLNSVYTVASSEILAEDRKRESTAKEKVGRKKYKRSDNYSSGQKKNSRFRFV